MESENPLSNNIIKIKTALEKSLSTNEKEREESYNFLNACKENSDYYCLCLLDILSNSNNDNNQQIYSRLGSVQLKNLIKEKWKTNSLNEITKKNVKDNIIKMFINSKEKLTLKVYQEIIRKILKYESSWEYYLDNIQTLINKCQNINYSNNNNDLFYTYCGLECFYLLSEKYEYENERDIYNECFNTLHIKFLFLYSYILDQLKIFNCINNNSNNINNSNIINNINTSNINKSNIPIYKKCLNKILKIYIKSIQMSPPNSFVEDLENIFIKMIEYDIQIDIKISRLFLWLIIDLYQKYFDHDRNKKESYHIHFINLAKKYLNQLFEFVYNFIKNQNSYDGISLSSAYKFIELAYQRKDILIYDKIINNISNIFIFTIKNNCITNKILSLTEKEYIYYLLDGGDSTKKSICSFIETLSKNMDKNLVLNIINLMYKEIEKYYNNHYLIPLESAIHLIKLIIFSYNDYNRTKEIYKNIISFYISNNLNFDKINNSVDNNLLCRFIDFISLLSKGNDFTFAENIYLLNKLIEGINLNNNIAINTVCALSFPSIIEKDKNLSDYYKKDIILLFKKYLDIIRETELESLIWGLESLIKTYSNETLSILNDLAKELISLFVIFTKNLSQINDDTQTKLDTTACEIIKTLVLLFHISSINSYQNFNELINLCNDLIIFGLSDQGYQLSIYMFENTVYLINSILDFSTNIDDNSNLWRYLDLLLDTIISKKCLNNINNNNNNSNNNLNTITIINECEYQPSRGYDLLQKIIPIFYNFIIKNPNNFINYLDKTFFVFQNVIIISKKESDFIQCCYSIKIYISIFEMFLNKNIDKLNNILSPVINFISDELLNINKTEDHNYLKFIVQLAFVVLSYNPYNVLTILNSNNKLNLVLEKLIDSIKIMSFEFEYKRLLFGLFSLFTVKIEMIPKILFNNMNFISNKMLEILMKYQKIYEKKMNRIRERKEKNLKKNNDDIIISAEDKDYDDIEESEEENDDDEEYEPEDESSFSDDNGDDDSTIEENYQYKKIKGLKTVLEETNLYKFIFDFIKLVQNNSIEQYKFIRLSFGEEGFNNLLNIINNAK